MRIPMRPGNSTGQRLRYSARTELVDERREHPAMARNADWRAHSQAPLQYSGLGGLPGNAGLASFRRELLRRSISQLQLCGGRLVELQVVSVGILERGDATPRVLADLPGDLNSTGS